MLLPLLCAISWGSHFAKNSFPIFAGFYLVDSQLVTPTGIGILLSLSSLPATFLPVLAGFLADRYFSISVITEIFLVATIVGQVFLTISCALENYSLMCWSMFIFGCGTSSVTSLQRSMIPIYLPSNESFSIGISITVAHIAKLAGKLYVLPLSKYMDSYITAMTLNIAACVLSWFLFRITILFFEDAAQYRVTQVHGITEMDHAGIVGHPRLGSENGRSRVETSMRLFLGNLLDIPGNIYTLILLHALYLVTFHVFLNFFPDIGRVDWKADRQKVVFLSCLPSAVILGVSPFIGMFADLTQRTKLLFLISSIFISIIFELMINEAINQFVAILMLSIFQSIATTLSLAAVCTIVPHRLNATTFGVIEVVDSLGSIIFNYCFGYLYDVKSGYRLGLVVISIVYWLGSSLVFYWFLVT